MDGADLAHPGTRTWCGCVSGGRGSGRLVPFAPQGVPRGRCVQGGQPDIDVLAETTADPGPPAAISPRRGRYQCRWRSGSEPPPFHCGGCEDVSEYVGLPVLHISNPRHHNGFRSKTRSRSRQSSARAETAVCGTRDLVVRSGGRDRTAARAGGPGVDRPRSWSQSGRGVHRGRSAVPARRRG
jgi:hypothetical protein